MTQQRTTQPNSKPRSARARQPDDSIKETLESVVMAFVLAFVFRAYVVEAFVIPTGSMAPTLLGAHLRVVCPQCGYAFTCDWPMHSKARRGDDTIPIPLRRGTVATCPMCHFGTFFEPDSRPKAGDRILVHKYIYSLAAPRRGDVVVFKNPSKPDQNYIKRLMGLPQERLWIIDGNIYIQPTVPGQAGAEWRIVRKTDRPEMQRAVWQPVYHSSYVPLDGGVGPEDDPADPRWVVPWSAQHPEQWDLGPRGGYRHKVGGAGALRFDFDRAERRGPGTYVYNQFSVVRLEPIEDVRVAASFEPEAEGLSIALSTTIRPPNDTRPGAELVPVIGRIDSQGRCSLELVDPVTDQLAVRPAVSSPWPLPAGRATTVELWYVDQEASLWVNGRCVVRWPFELEIEVVKRRPFPDQGPLLQRPHIRIKVDGPAVTLHRVQVDRDLYYSSRADSADGKAMLVKVMDPRGHLTEARGEYIELEADQFFCLGDNSPRSLDGRYWTQRELNPWIRTRMLAHNKQQTGVVPRKLLMGRAFFVYFPPPYSWRPERMGLVPNFGDLRFIN